MGGAKPSMGAWREGRQEAMNATIYTPAEVAEILKVSEGDILTLVCTGELQAFRVLGKPRITEQALEELMNRSYNGEDRRQKKKTQGSRDRNPQSEQAGRRRIMDKIRQVAPDVRLLGERTRFTANGKQLILRVATKQVNQGYWFGFKAEFLRNGRPTFLILALADREDDLVIPCEKFKAVIDGLSVSGAGDKKLYVQVRGGVYYLAGKGIEQPIPLDSYVNAFHLLR